MERNLIGKQIQKYREQAGLKQEELAELIGKSPIFVSYMERGIRKPGLDTLLSLSEALNVSIDILLGNRASPALVSGLPLIQEMLHALPEQDHYRVLEIFEETLRIELRSAKKAPGGRPKK